MQANRACKSHRAKLLVIDQLSDGRVFTTQGTFGILTDSHFPEAHTKCIECEEAANEWVPYIQE